MLTAGTGSEGGRYYLGRTGGSEAADGKECAVVDLSRSFGCGYFWGIGQCVCELS